MGKRQVLTPDEVMRLPQDEEIVVLRGQDILKAKKFDYTEHPDSRFLRPCNADDHVPAWRIKNRKKGKKKAAAEAAKSGESAVGIQEEAITPGNMAAEKARHNVTFLR